LSTTSVDPGPGQASGTGRSRWLALGVLALGLSMIVLDGTIVGVALPRIITDLGLDLADAQWVNAIYAMVFAALLLTVGRIGDRWGRRRTFVAGVVVFVVASVLAGRADSGGSLIAARALQGLGGALVLPSTLSTVNATFRGKDRATAFGIWGAVMAGMAAIGPLLGGWLTTTFDWRWVFTVNVPLGALVLLGTVLVVPETRGAPGRKGVDVDGLLTSAIGLGLLVFGLIEGTTYGWWRPLADFHLLGRTWGTDAPLSPAPVAIAVGIVFIGLFVLWERHRARVGRDAVLDLTLFGSRAFSWGNVTAAAVAAGEFALVFLLPLFLVNVLGLGIMGAGWVLAAMAIGAFVSGSQARHLAERMPPTKVVLLGLALEVVGVAALAVLVRPGPPGWLVAVPLVVYGTGLGLASAQLTSTILAGVPAAQSGSASATQSTARQVGSAFGTAFVGSALAVGLGHTLPDRLAGVGGLPADVVGQLTDSTTASAGGVIAGLRDQGTHGQLGALGPQVADALSAGFADATRWGLLVALTLLVVGLVGAVVVDRVRLS
jgi:EmrB/QacA subfamily drug resistance transporter